jgi:hypothetical protein
MTLESKLCETFNLLSQNLSSKMGNDGNYEKSAKKTGQYPERNSVKPSKQNQLI